MREDNGAVGSERLRAPVRSRSHPSSIVFLLMISVVAVGLLLGGCGGTPDPSAQPAPGVDRSLAGAEQFLGAQQYQQAIEAYATVLVGAEAEDDLVTRVIAYLGLTTAWLRLGEDDRARRQFATAEQLLPLATEEAPDLDPRQAALLRGRFFETRAQLAAADGEPAAAAADLDRAEAAYLDALN